MSKESPVTKAIPNELLTTEEVARRMYIKPKTLLNMVSDGEFSGCYYQLKKAGRLYWNWERVIAWFESRNRSTG